MLMKTKVKYIYISQSEIKTGLREYASTKPKVIMDSFRPSGLFFGFG